MQKYGEQDGDKYVIRPENVDVCNGELEELLNIDVDIPEKIDILSTNVVSLMLRKFRRIDPRKEKLWKS